VTTPKFQQVAAAIRRQIAEGMLIPGEPVPSGAALARATGYSVLTCRKALFTLIRDGVLVPGASPTARLRVAGPATANHDQTVADAGRTLSAALARYRRAQGFTQPQLATAVGKSITTVGHAETGRLWQSRDFWERADKTLYANGELLALHDAYRSATAGLSTLIEAQESAAVATDIGRRTTTGNAKAAEMELTVVPKPVACVTITWANGVVTKVWAPGS
jgi:DNA-binding transcriptional regulator YhcF (GntR family)